MLDVGPQCICYLLHDHVNFIKLFYILHEIYYSLILSDDKLSHITNSDCPRKIKLHRGHIPDPQKPGGMKYDKKEYLKTLRLEAKKHNIAMKQIINNRSTKNHHIKDRGGAGK